MNIFSCGCCSAGFGPVAKSFALVFSGVALLGIASSPLPALEVPLTIANVESVAKLAEPITSGVPFAQGVLADATSVRLLSGTNELSGQFLTTACWPDHSVRWLLCDFQADLPAGDATAVTLQTGTAPAPTSGIAVTNGATSLQVNTGAAAFTFSKTQFGVRGNAFTVSYAGVRYTAVPASNWVIEESGPMKAVVRVDGVWRRGTAGLRDNLIGFRARLFFYWNKTDARVAFTFRNNNSFGWDSGLNKRGDLVLSGLQCGSTALLPAGGAYVFGSGVEKTFNVIVPAVGAPYVREARYDRTGNLAVGWRAERPLALAAPAYYASTFAWGRISLPISGLPADRQADFNRFEKMQRSMVDPTAVENPTNLIGITAFGHLAQDVASWNNYGCLRWGGEQGPWSGNHYDWSYGMYLQMMRTGAVRFANLARVMARHEIDLDLYHTRADSTAFNHQKNWEGRPSHNNPDNTFGGGRPTHTWTQGYALHWLLTGDPRGRDACEELIDGIRQYLYESFSGEGHVNTNEIRTQGWLVDNLVTQWRLNPDTAFATSYGAKTVPAAIKDILQNVFTREAAAGGAGFVHAGDQDTPDPRTRHPLQNCYFIEAAAKAYEEVYVGRDDAYASKLLALEKRMTRFLMGVTFGGDLNAAGLYRPLQIPEYMNTPSERTLGQIPYLLMAANGAGFCYLHGGETDFLAYLRSAFQDYCRYFSAVGEDGRYVSPSLRMPTSYNSMIYVDTESKVHGWSGRYGMFVFDAERAAASDPDRTPPTTTGFTPANGASGISLAPNLGIAFSENVVKASVGNLVIGIPGGVVLETIPVLSGRVVVYGNRISIDPVRTFASGTTYSVTITPGAFTDYAGNPFAGITDDTTWRFTTGLFAPGTVNLADSGISVNPGTPVFRWTAIAGATGYDVEVFNRGTGAVVLRGGAAASMPVAQVRFGTRLAPGSYWWRVRAHRGGVVDAWSGAGTFLVVRL